MIEYPLPVATKICSDASDVKFVYTEAKAIRFPLDCKNGKITAKPRLPEQLVRRLFDRF